MKRRVLIMGAAGRDFHNFNVFFRENDAYEVVGFTATQIPDIEGRVYPPELAGERYPKGIPIYPEEDLEKLIKEKDVDLVVFAYSDVSHEYVMSRASRAMACGASFMLLGPKDTMLKSKKPVVAVGAIRTGCGKSQTSRRVADILKSYGKKVAVVRHPMPYGDLRKQVVQKFETYEDLDKYNVTVEEREEFEPHLDRGNIVFAGVDYGKILEEAEKVGDVILWDGGNNDFPFFKPDLFIVVTDPHRAGHELKYHPGETNLRMADVIVINKIDSANLENINILRKNIMEANPKATVIEAASPIFVENYEMIKGKRVLCIEDGPTTTHGEMKFGAAYIAALKFGAKEIIKPYEYAIGSIKKAMETWGVVDVLPALGYSPKQIEELQEVINSCPADIVISATLPLPKLYRINNTPDVIGSSHQGLKSIGSVYPHL
ncbi:MAG: cyclic 2,3-diphosphoglycerate synthase, partial [candidate division WOR-3 bacterium]